MIHNDAGKPRIARIDTPGVIHHVVIRGIEKEAISWDQADREDFIRRLEALIPKKEKGVRALTVDLA